MTARAPASGRAQSSGVAAARLGSTRSDDGATQRVPGCDFVLLDESFAALDLERMKQCLERALRRAPALVVIAHP